MKESHYFTQFVNERNLSKATVKQYRATLRQYCEFQGLSLDELIDEADSEEEEGIRMKKRTSYIKMNFLYFFIKLYWQRFILTKNTKMRKTYIL